MRLVLAAQLAAARMGRRHRHAPRSRTGWRPAVLLWRGRWVNPTGTRKREAVPTVHHVWRVAAHLHFGLHAVERPPRRARPLTAFSGPRALRRPDPLAVGAARPAAVACPVSRLRRRATHAMEATSRPIPPAPAHDPVMPPLRPPLAGPIASRPGHRVVRARRVAPRDIAHLAAPAPGQAIRQTRLRTLVRTTEMLTRQRGLVTSVGDAAAPGPATSPTGRWGRMPELVWSDPRREAAEPTATAQARTVAVSAPRFQAPQPSTRESSSEAPPPPARSAAIPVTILDPVLVDRLADDVIRRVERRVRIERERRGL